MKGDKNVFTEFGIDFDNNRFGLGYSTEIEERDGTEYRVKKLVKMDLKSVYLRIWLFKKVLYLSFDEVSVMTKNRNNFKFVIGFGGVKKIV